MPERDQEVTESPKRYIWALLIIPLGLIVGTVTSTYNHIKSDQAKDSEVEYRVSQSIDAKSIKADVGVAYQYPTSDITQQLRRVSSALGLDAYLTTRVLENAQTKAGFIDIEGKRKKAFVVVLIDLDDSDRGVLASKFGLGVAVIKSLLGEIEHNNSLRFMFVSQRRSADLHALDVVQKGERLVKLFVLRSSELRLTGKQWLSSKSPSYSKGYVLSHPVLGEQADVTSPEHIDSLREAGENIRPILLKLVQ